MTAEAGHARRRREKGLQIDAVADRLQATRAMRREADELLALLVAHDDAAAREACEAALEGQCCRLLPPTSNTWNPLPW